MNCGPRVGDKGNKQWVWLALDVQTREISEFTSATFAQNQHSWLWQSLPPVYRLQCGDLQRFLVSLCGGLTEKLGLKPRPSRTAFSLNTVA
jgi:IS1 family transposase